MKIKYHVGEDEETVRLTGIIFLFICLPFLLGLSLLTKMWIFIVLLILNILGIIWEIRSYKKFMKKKK